MFVTRGIVFVLLLVVQLTAGSSLAAHSPTCTDFVVPVTIQRALNANLPLVLTLNLFDLLSAVISIVSGSLQVQIEDLGILLSFPLLSSLVS